MKVDGSVSNMLYSGNVYSYSVRKPDFGVNASESCQEDGEKTGNRYGEGVLLDISEEGFKDAYRKNC